MVTMATKGEISNAPISKIFPGACPNIMPSCMPIRQHKILRRPLPEFNLKCCERRRLHDKHTPGLFKLEWVGDVVVALWSKNYLCFDAEYASKNKVSTKGLSKRQNAIRKEHFMSVLQLQEPLQVWTAVSECTTGKSSPTARRGRRYLSSTVSERCLLMLCLLSPQTCDAEGFTTLETCMGWWTFYPFKECGELNKNCT